MKFIFGMVVCLFIRLIPFRAPNIEPLLATQMPFSRVYGAWAGFLFGVLSIIAYDLLTSTLGVWTLITASAYGALGIMAHFYFLKFKASALHYAGFAVLGTLFFDAVTGLTIGPLLFNQSFAGALSGQVPFTAMHLLGNVSFALLLSPAIYNYVIKSRRPKGSGFRSKASEKKKRFTDTLIINPLSPKEV